MSTKAGASAAASCSCATWLAVRGVICSLKPAFSCCQHCLASPPVCEPDSVADSLAIDTGVSTVRQCTIDTVITESV